MRVVDVTQWYAPRSGGIRTYLHAKATYAGRHRLAHAMVVPGAHATTDRVARSPVIALAGLPTGQAAGYRLIPHPASIERALERLRPSVLVIHDAMAFPRSLVRWARARSVPTAMFVHSDLAAGAPAAPTHLRGPVEHVLRTLQSRGLQGPDAVIAASHRTAALLRERHGVRAFVSPLGVDTSVFRPQPPNPALRRSLAEPTETLLLHCGRLSPEKRPQLLVDALARLHDDCVLAIAGEGSAADELLRRARTLGVAPRVRLLGHIGVPERLAELHAVADCYVHANPAEPFGLAPLEALASGCRVVLPADCGSAEALREGDATLVAPGSAEALARGVDAALRGPRPVPDLERLSWDSAFDREWALYRGLAMRAAQGWAA